MNLPLKLLIEECIENCQYSDEAALASRWISDVRILGEDEFLKKDVLYIDLGETSIPENSKYENNIVVLTHIREVGKLPADYQWIAVVENLNPLQIAGKMQNVFREFQKWNMKLYDACSFGCNLQELLNVSANMTKNCIYIADMSFKVLVYANAEIMPEISATWRYQVAHGYLPVHVMKGLLNSGEFEDLNGFRRAAHFYSKNFNVPFLTKNVFYNNKPQAHLFIVNSLKRPTYRDIAIGQILGEFI